MLKIGEYNHLRIDRFTSVGAFLSDDEQNEVLIPKKYLDPNWEIDEKIEVFVYNDSEDRIVATTETPLVKVNEFAALVCKSVTPIGAFLDWGMLKDLLVPLKLQTVKMTEGNIYMIYMFLDDKTNRLVATAKINPHFKAATSDDYEVGNQVNLLVGRTSDLGTQVIVDQKYAGLVFNNRLTRHLYFGEEKQGYIEAIREDGKLDISLDPIGIEKFDVHQTSILDYLNENKGRMYITDKSDPDEIRRMLNMSKKSFKKAIGALYKARKIKLEEDTIELI